MEKHLGLRKNPQIKDKKKNKLLTKLLSEESQILQNKTSNDYFNSFIYTDHITNDTMTVKKDLVFKPLPSKSRFSHKDYFNDTNPTINNQCLTLLKSTRKFHLSSIQSKNYKGKSTENNSCRITHAQDFNPYKTEKEKLIHYIKKKKEEKENFNLQKQILSKFLQNINLSTKKQIQNATKKNNLQNEQDKQQDKKRQINRLTFPHCIISNRSSPQKTLSFHNSQKRQYLKPVNSKDIKRQNKNLRDFIVSRKKHRQNEFEEAQILQSANNELKYLVRKNGQFLITPKLAKRLMNKKNKDKYPQEKPKKQKFTRLSSIMGATRYKLLQQYQNEKQYILDNQQRCQKQSKQYQQYMKPGQLDEYNFKLQDQNTLLRQMKLIKCEGAPQISLDETEMRLIRAIEEGNYFKVQIQLSVNPRLLLIKEPQNMNNLLHICVMNNKCDIFEMILKKCRENKIDLLTQQIITVRSKPFRFGKYTFIFPEIVDNETHCHCLEVKICWVLQLYQTAFIVSYHFMTINNQFLFIEVGRQYNQYINYHVLMDCLSIFMFFCPAIVPQTIFHFGNIISQLEQSIRH